MDKTMQNSQSKLFVLLTAFAVTLLTLPASADDTDIYYGGNVNFEPGGEPIVMLSLDWRPNLGSPACDSTVRVEILDGDGEGTGVYEDAWACEFIADELEFFSGVAAGPDVDYTFLDALRAVLKKVMDPLEGVRVGLMMNHDYQNNCAGPESQNTPKCSNGGYIAYGAKSFQEDDANGAKAGFYQKLKEIPTPRGNASHKYQGSELFFELFRYLTGQGIYNGHVGYLDYSSDNTINLDAEGIGPSWDQTIEEFPNDGADPVGENYVSPMDTFGACAKIFTINLMFQVSQQESDSDDAIAAPLEEGGMGIEQKGLEDVVGWLYDKDLSDQIDGTQNVKSFFIVDERFINTTTYKYAQAGGTNAPLPMTGEPSEVYLNIQDIFSQVLSVSTTFVAASVPVNTFNRAEIIDNVYIALFQVDEYGRPFWQGNVKKLVVDGLDEDIPTLVDARGDPAMAADGRIRYSALTYWTDPGTLPDPNVDNNEVAGSDGRSVTRGGGGQKIPGYVSGSPGTANGSGTRQLYYDAGNALANFDSDVDTATALQTALNAIDPDEAAELIQFARGLDVDDLDGDNDTEEARDWIMADALHSRPLPLNYGSRGVGYNANNPAIYIAVGSNDGYMRFLRNTTGTSGQSGEEVWGFMPQSVMDKVKIHRTNSSAEKHPYMVDGAPVAYLEDINGNGTIDIGEKAYLFFMLRRGGKAIYALDVSDPENPELLWKKDNTDTGFAELAYTFSNPRIITTREGGTLRPALAFGGGYDLNKDDRSGVGTDDDEGNAIFIVEMETGDLIWKAAGPGPFSAGLSGSAQFYHPDLVDSIPSTLATLDADGDYTTDRLYVGDTGGNPWRADINDTDKSEWKLSRVARLGRHAYATPSKVNDRRFFHRPDVIQTFEVSNAPYDAIVLGSGDRPDPLDAATGDGDPVENWSYMIKDTSTAPGGATDRTLTHVGLGDITNTCLTQGSACVADLTNGWRLNLTAPGEKQLSSPITIANNVYFTTYVPDEDITNCDPKEGTGRLYAIGLKSGWALNNYDTTTDDPERFTKLKSSGIPAEVVSIPKNFILRPDGEFENTNTEGRIETYWFEEEDGDL